MEFLHSLPGERISYVHIAGHYNEAEDLIVDTHGADVIDPVWALLDYTLAKTGPRPALIEWDANVPDWPQLAAEAARAAQALDKVAP